MDDPALFFDEDRLARARALSRTLSGNAPDLQAAGIPLGMPGAPQSASTGGTAAPAAPVQPDYRSKALALMQQAAGAGEPNEEESADSNRKLVLALALGMKGGEAMQPASGLILKQALSDPEAKAQRRQQRLESQSKIYESMAQHADSLEQRKLLADQAERQRQEAASDRWAMFLQGDQTRRAIGDAARAQSQGQHSFQQENSLRDDFEKQVKDQRISIATYPQIEAALTQKVPSAASDMRAIFRYMKMLDPTSVVRESEYATAKNAASIPERIRNMYNQAVNGRFLDPMQRADFLAQAKSERDTAMKFFNERGAEFSERARGYGLNPRNVVLGYDGPQQAASRGGLPPGVTVTRE